VGIKLRCSEVGWPASNDAAVHERSFDSSELPAREGRRARESGTQAPGSAWV